MDIFYMSKTIAHGDAFGVYFDKGISLKQS